ncbi:hypothetical protein [Streptomyces sp. NPDC002490]|uniref:hypothetical protein n=1 Tax=Streptomyces sp. NPDC002490 TaxID=3154416 RepID=UPI00332866BB
MKESRKKHALSAAAMTAGLALITFFAYATKTPPFHTSTSIQADEVCTSLGDSPEVLPALKIVLPKGQEYSFWDKSIPNRTQRSIRLLCLASTSSDRSEMTLGGRVIPKLKSDEWLAWLKGDFNEEVKRESLTSFKAGDDAAASSRGAGIQIPCFANKRTPNPQENIHISISLTNGSDAGAEKTRKALIDILRSSAAHAHKEMKCDLPSKL